MIDRNPTEDKSDYRATFLNLVLFELGHPDEPEETLLEVLKSIKDYSDSDAFITNWEDAVEAVDVSAQIRFQTNKNIFRERERRIMARKEREPNGAH